MPLFSARWQNFRSFEDTGWIDFRPITVVLGANASGKTSLIAPLLLLKQTDESRDATLALKTKGALFNAGSYRDLIFRHEAARELGLELRFRRFKTDPAQSELDLGAVPPGQLSLTYQAGDDDERALLAVYAVDDAPGRRMVTRHRRSDGTYDLVGLPLPTADQMWQTAIESTPPSGFLFDPRNVFSAYYAALQKANPSGPPEKSINISVGEAHSLYFAIASTTATDVNQLLSETKYIGPLRERPRRIYEIGGEAPFSVGPGGQYAPEILFRSRDTPLAGAVNEWIRRFEFGERVDCRPLAAGVFALELQRGPSCTSVNLADTGFGLSQVLPLIVEGFFADPGSMIVAEQPEIHLNPKLQSELADLFAAVAARKVKVLVETHSEHMLLRLRRLIAEKTIKASDVAVYFTERRDDFSTVRRIQLEDTGHIQTDQWPLGFFEDSLAESLALATAQAKRVRNGK